MRFVFLIFASKGHACWHIHQAINSSVCMLCTPQLIVSKPAYWSILRTIEIVIDLPHLGPVAIRSYLLSVPYWKGKHSWCCSQSARCCDVRLAPCVLYSCSPPTSPMMDGANFLGTHLLQHVPPAHQWVEIDCLFVSDES